MKDVLNYIKKKLSLNKDNIITIIWVFILIIVIAILFTSSTREKFVYATRDYPYFMGILELGILGTMGDLLGYKIANGRGK